MSAVRLRSPVVRITVDDETPPTPRWAVNLEVLPGGIASRTYLSLSANEARAVAVALLRAADDWDRDNPGLGVLLDPGWS